MKLVVRIDGDIQGSVLLKVPGGVLTGEGCLLERRYDHDV